MDTGASRMNISLIVLCLYLPIICGLLIPTATITTSKTTSLKEHSHSQPTAFKPLFKSRASKSFKSFKRRLERRGYAWIADQMAVA